MLEQVRQSFKKMKNNEAPIVSGLSEENIQRGGLEDIGFDWNDSNQSVQRTIRG